MPQFHFDAPLESNQEAHFVRVPAAVLTALGQGKRMPVRVTINGYTYRSTIAVYGGKYYLGVRREVREAAGVAAGDQLAVALEYDAELRTIDLPEAVRSALETDAQARATFEKLSFTNKKELVQWVTEAKRAETQRRRLNQALTNLRGRARGPR